MSAGTPTERLAELGLTLPKVAAPLAAYVPSLKDGDLVFTSGQLPLVDGTLAGTGKVGAEITAERGAELARICGLNCLAALAEAAGGLDKVEKIMKVVVYVASDPSFTAHPAVGNGASELFGEVLGDAGIHARSAVGVTSLPLDAPVEVEVVARVSA